MKKIITLLSAAFLVIATVFPVFSYGTRFKNHKKTDSSNYRVYRQKTSHGYTRKYYYNKRIRAYKRAIYRRTLRRYNRYYKKQNHNYHHFN